MFVDKVRIFIESGKGGDGCLSFRREKYIPKGGPDGGNGGKGGDVYLQSDPQLNTLLDFIYQPHYKSQNGFPGKSKNMYGADAEDLVIKVPCGTVVYKIDENNNRCFLYDFKKPYEKIIVAYGGRGGRGNLSFKTHTNTAPRISEKGQPGEKVTLELELKLIADVGIVGCPNAGKSTLLSTITSARPKIADYPFTTVAPNLGITKWKDKNFVVVDVPGLIEGAHQGKGLGIEFLRHIERTKIILHLIDVFGYGNKTAYQNYCLINKELKQYSPILSKKPMIIVLNKIDITGSESKLKEFKNKIKNKKIFSISAVTKFGIPKLLDEIIRMLNEPVKFNENIYIPVEKKYVFDPEFKVIRENNIFIVKGKNIEDLVAMTNFNQEEAVERLQNIFRKMGIEKILKKHNIREGDTIKIGNYEFIYKENGIGNE